MGFSRKHRQNGQIVRSRMLRETELFLEEALCRPDQQIRIPTLRVGSGKFTRGYADLFWSAILGSS